MTFDDVFHVEHSFDNSTDQNSLLLRSGLPSTISRNLFFSATNRAGVRQWLRPDDEATFTGINSNAEGMGSAAFGAFAEASGSKSISLGYGSRGQKTGSVAIGEQADADGYLNISIGRRTVNRSAQSVLIGSLAFSNNATNSTGVGYSITLSGTSATVIGSSAAASGTNGTAVGQASNSGSGTGNTAVGQSGEITATGNNNTGVGQDFTISGSGTDNCTLVGQGSSASSDDCTIVGQGASSTALRNIVLGKGAAGSHNDVVVIGNGGVSAVANQVVIGTPDMNFTDLTFGRGPTHSQGTPANCVIRTSSGSGTDKPGDWLNLIAGAPTGNAAGGVLGFWTGTGTGAGSGSTTRTLYERMRIYDDGGIVVNNSSGTEPTGSSNGAGTINLTGDLYKNDTAYTNPDYVLEHYFTGQIERFAGSPGASDYVGLLPLETVFAYMKQHYRLPRVAEAKGMFERGDRVLEKIEELFLYLIDLHRGVKLLNDRMTALETKNGGPSGHSE